MRIVANICAVLNEDDCVQWGLANDRASPITAVQASVSSESPRSQLVEKHGDAFPMDTLSLDSSSSRGNMSKPINSSSRCQPPSYCSGPPLWLPSPSYRSGPPPEAQAALLPLRPPSNRSGPLPPLKPPSNRGPLLPLRPPSYGSGPPPNTRTAFKPLRAPPTPQAAIKPLRAPLTPQAAFLPLRPPPNTLDAIKPLRAPSYCSGRAPNTLAALLTLQSRDPRPGRSFAGRRRNTAQPRPHKQKQAWAPGGCVRGLRGAAARRLPEDSGGHWAPRIRASRAAGPPSAAPGSPPRHPKRGRRDRGQHQGGVRSFPTALDQLGPGPGGASRRDLYPFPLNFPGLPLRPDNSSDTQSRSRVDPPIQNQPTNQTTSPKPGRFPASAADLIRAALPARGS
ncbi:hypothetical protein H8959_021587 [Pygathrix nigripes]